MTEHKESQVQTLVARVQRGDKNTFDELMAQFQGRVGSYITSRARFYIGSKLDVEEILQETFVRAYQSIARFCWKDDDSFFKWLCGIAKHVLMQTIERTRNNEPIEKAQDIPASSTSPSRVLRREERLDQLHKSLAALTDDYRAVLYMSRIEGITTKEIARRMKRSPNAVSHLIARALSALKAQFGDTESLHLPDQPLTRERHKDEG